MTKKKKARGIPSAGRRKLEKNAEKANETIRLTPTFKAWLVTKFTRYGDTYDSVLQRLTGYSG